MADEEAPNDDGDGGTSTSGGCGTSRGAGVGAFALPELAGPLGDVVAGELSFDDAAETLAAAGRLSAWTEALKARLVARLDETSAGTVPQPEMGAPTRSVRGLARMNVQAEISGALTIPETTAQKLIFESGELVTTFGATLAGLEAGELNRDQAIVIVDQAQTLPEEAQPCFEAELLAAAPGMPRPNLRGKARRLRERLHPETITRRKAKAACDRRVDVEPREDGMAYLGAYLPAEAAVAAYNRVTAAAGALQGPAEARTKTQLRADVFTDLLTAGPPPAPAAPHGSSDHNSASGSIDASRNDSYSDSDGHGGRGGNPAPAGTTGPVPEAPSYGSIKAEVVVTVPVLTLLGLSEEPSELEGYGPMDAETARKLCAGASSFKRILTHPETGAMISYGRDTYKVPADLKRMINIRDRCCRVPGCNRAAKFTELDHTKPWAAGGTTDYENVKCYCARHHLLKTACGWTDTQDKDGTITLTSPAGRVYTSRPEGPVLTSRKDAARHKKHGTGHRFDPWNPKNAPTTEPPADSDGTDGDNPPPF